jgi:OPA family glycerol-3-phosphate transporter-like MFS transporter
LRPAIAGLLAACALSAVGLALLQQSLFGSAVVLAIISCFVYGANTLLLTVVPLQYHRYGLTSSVAGALDAVAYLGAASSGLLNGWLADSGGWGTVALVWAAVAFAAADLVAWSQRRNLKPASVNKAV